MRRGVTAVATIAAAMMLAMGVPGAGSAGSAASTASSWTLQPVPLATGAHGAELTGVSCPSSVSCFAAAEFFGISAPGVEQWNGSTWTPQTLPPPTGQNDGTVTAISCASPVACTAVGYYVAFPSGNFVALAEQWNGSAWTAEAVPPPAAELTSVSCPAAASCTATSTYTAAVSGGQAAVVEQWNGTKWTAHATALLPAGVTTARLTAISCPSTTSCIATGYTNQGALAERWAGTAWTLLPAGGGGALSCVSAANCTSVGVSGDSGTQFLPQAEHWNGSTWTTIPVPLPSGGTNGALSGVSCTSATRCTAAGWWNQGSPTGRHKTLAEVWNGTAWRPQPTAQPPGRKTLLAISCTAARTCTAVGVGEPVGNPYMQPVAENK